MEAIVQIKNVFGNKTVYPVNEAAKTLAAIAGTKTLTTETIELAKQLGFTFTVQADSL